jgi:hypothetical protein
MAGFLPLEESAVTGSNAQISGRSPPGFVNGDSAVSASRQRP